MRERELISWIASHPLTGADRVPVGPGDDLAVVSLGAERLLVGCDQVLDGVHLNVAEHGPEAAGRKALARNLSDVAAMAGKPLAAVATVALPKGAPDGLAEGVYRGMRNLADAFDCPIVGGDVAFWDQPLVISLTVLAETAGVEPVLRSGARAGDALLVTGRLGGGWRTEHHLTFTPRVAEARALAHRCPIHAMIDLSDGLASDVAHIARASGVTVEITEAHLPVRPGATAGQALADGEDYELLLAVAVDDAEALLSDPPIDVPLTRVGIVTERQAGLCFLIDQDGHRSELADGGWEHTG